MWTEGVAAIDYTHAFYPEMAPGLLAFALLLKGVAPPVEAGEPFAYGELGCGQGLTSNLLAAVHPEARFEAVDLLPNHIDGARSLAADAGNGNALFHRESFADFATREGPAFDIIALHGVWTWVGADDRRVLLDIIERRLKPGGVLFLSYNCLPGWAADMPVRRLLLDQVAAGTGPLSERIDGALAFLHRLARHEGYFERVPGAEALLQSLRGKSDGYIAHEYLNRNWTPFYHPDVAAEVAAAGLEFAASATLLDHLDPWRMSDEAVALVAACADATARETLRDTLTYCRFRRDLFVRSPRRLSPEERRARLGALRFGLAVPRADVPESVSMPGGERVLAADLYVPLADALAEGAVSLDELMRRPGLRAQGFDAVIEALTAQVGLGVTVPSLAAGDANRCARFNGAVLARNRQAPDVRQMASPVLGGGIIVDMLDRLFLLAEQEGRDPADFAWEVLAGRGKRLRRDGRWLDGAENLAELRSLHVGFLKARRPHLARLGVAV